MLFSHCSLDGQISRGLDNGLLVAYATNMNNNDYIQPLQALGFTEIESLVYGFLVENSPATGYRISHAIGKQPPNTYKAITSLESKGAIIVEVGEKKLCRAVPPTELLDTLEGRFRQHRQEAARSLETLSRRSRDDRIYHLKTVDQVIQRSKAMLDRAQGIVLCDLFPGTCALLAEALEQTAARGVQVFCKVYGGERIPGVNVQQLGDHDPSLDRWPGQQLSIVIDSEEHLLALLAKDLESVHEAVWSTGTFLSCMHHNHVASEIRMTALHAAVGEQLDSPEQSLSQITLLTFQPTGLTTLVQRYSPNSRNEDNQS
ncbi:MAG: TrmB family transcriptional regulator [bacterium]|nr:TrmB family transcriptional regulator [bacterium]